LTKQELFKCFGTPVGEEQIDDLDFLTFAGKGEKATDGTFEKPSAEIAGDSSKRILCTATTFVLKNGLVQHVYTPSRVGNLYGNGENCVFNNEKCE